MHETSTALQDYILRGQIYLANLDPTIGSEQSGIRPVLIVQNDVGNRHSPTTIVVPITSRPKKSLPTHLLLLSQPSIETGSVLLLEQIRTLDKSRLGKLLGKLNPQMLKQVDACLMTSLSLSQNQGVPLLMTLCRECAGHYRDTDLYVLHRIYYEQQITEPCMLCLRPGFDYEVTRR